jgi:hypothetical protein
MTGTAGPYSIPVAGTFGTVRTPARFTSHDIGRDSILGVWLNDEDVEIAHVYDLIRSENDNGDD